MEWMHRFDLTFLLVVYITVDGKTIMVYRKKYELLLEKQLLLLELTELV